MLVNFTCTVVVCEMMMIMRDVSQLLYINNTTKWHSIPVLSLLSQSILPRRSNCAKNSPINSSRLLTVPHPSPALLPPLPIYPHSFLVTFLPCSCVCVCVRVHVCVYACMLVCVCVCVHVGVVYKEYTVLYNHYFRGFGVYTYVDLVQRSMLTLISERPH